MSGNGYEELPPAPHALPVADTVPEPFICKHCVEPLPSPDITKLVVEAMVAESTDVVALVALSEVAKKFVDVAFVVDALVAKSESKI